MICDLRQLTPGIFRCRKCKRTFSSPDGTPPVRECLPALGTQVKSAVTAQTRWALAGCPVRSKPEQEALLVICQDCPKFLPDSIRCSTCGCWLLKKIRMTTEHCPLGKW